jgi:hypothetical protein
VNDPVLGAHLLGVFTTIWSLYYLANVRVDTRLLLAG